MKSKLLLLAILLGSFALVSAQEAAPKIRALIVGGGTHHDFDRWFNTADVATLKATGKIDAEYTGNTDSVLPKLKSIDVLYLSNNQPMKGGDLRKAIFDLADLGRGLLLVHPALWYNWSDWPEYNRKLVGGGARSHDKYGEFEVTVDQPDHPVMKGVPASFRIADELYHFQKDAEGASIQVLATGRNLSSGKTYPVVWIVHHPKARILAVTLGHDGKAHEHDAFKSLLQNGATWAAGKK